MGTGSRELRRERRRAVVRRDGHGSGRVGFAFAERNEYGVLDHEVTLPSGEVLYNPMRVVPDGSGCEVVFTIRRPANMSDEDFARDADAVKADLASLKRLLESPARQSPR
jgi:hypothetical protein